MDFRKTIASCEEARQMDIVSYLSSLGYEPAKIRNADYWYHSPLRNEKTPSFKVNRKLNKWFDHGLGKGGNLIDFAILYNNCTVGEFLRTLEDIPSFRQPDFTTYANERQAIESRIKIVDENNLTSFALQRYLYQRRIPLEVAKQFCKEVKYEILDKKYFAIGFQNNSGGYELRNRYFKGSATPKDISSFDNGANEVAVFEGLFDFLSFITITQNQERKQTNFLVLNSTSFFEKARLFMEQHDVINLFLDHDQTGQKCTRYALTLSVKYTDKSALYERYNDLNDWMINIGKSPNLTST